MSVATLSSRQSTLAEALLTDRRSRSIAVNAALIVAASLLVAASARVVVPLPFTPVPFTGQTFGVLIVGMLLGSRRGALALALYLLEGSAGLPFFFGGSGGVSHLLGPTGGYLVSYPLAAALVGYLTERGWDRRPRGAALTMALGCLFILAVGSLWLSVFVGGIGSGFAKGMLPFLPIEAIKVVLAGGLLPGGWAILRRLQANK